MSLHPPQEHSPDVIAQAAHWDARLRSPYVTDDDRLAFAQWRDNDAACRAAFCQLQASLRALDNAATTHPTLLAWRQRAQQHTMQQAHWRRRALAAIVLLLPAGALSAYWWLSAGSSHPEFFAAGSRQTGHFRDYATGTGERSTISLDDGSVIELNTHSRVRVTLTTRTRAVTLLEGQALFEVAHDPARPFVVSAGHRRITALGTAFDVRLRAGEVTVTMVEGRVAVHNTAGDGIDVERASSSTELVAGQRLVAPASLEAPSIQMTDIELTTSWRRGQIILEDAALGEAVEEINRYIEAPILVTDPQMVALRVNGMFRTGQTAGFLSAIQAYYPIDAVRQPDGRIFLFWRTSSFISSAP